MNINHAQQSELAGAQAAVRSALQQARATIGR